MLTPFFLCNSDMSHPLKMLMRSWFLWMQGWKYTVDKVGFGRRDSIRFGSRGRLPHWEWHFIRVMWYHRIKLCKKESLGAHKILNFLAPFNSSYWHFSKHKWKICNWFSRPLSQFFRELFSKKAKQAEALAEVGVWKVCKNAVMISFWWYWWLWWWWWCCW